MADWEERYNMERVHTLKTWPLYWDAVYRGEKTFEVRRDDRGFQVGDTLELVRWSPGNEGELLLDTDEGAVAMMVFTVTYLLPGGSFGIEPGYCVLGLGNKTILRE